MGKQKSEIGIDFDDKYLTKCGILPKKERKNKDIVRYLSLKDIHLNNHICELKIVNSFTYRIDKQGKPTRLQK